jgi:hypothetical protein
VVDTLHRMLLCRCLAKVVDSLIIVFSFNRSDEWYQSYRSLRHLLNPIHFAAQGNGVRSWNRPQPSAPEGVASFPARDACRILILGCGNSCFGEDMRKGK